MSLKIFGAVASFGLNLYNANESAAQSAASAAERKQALERQALIDLKKLQISSNIQARANEVHSIWQSYYYPQERQTVAEICAEPYEVDHSAAVRQRAIGELAKIYARKKKNKTYCLAPQQVGLRLESEIQLSIEQADATANLTKNVARAEAARVRLQDQQRLNNKLNMINAGRGQQAAAANALTAAAGAYDALSKQVAKDITDAAYVQGRSLRAAYTGAKEVVKNIQGFSSVLEQQERIRPEQPKLLETDNSFLQTIFDSRDGERQSLTIEVNATPEIFGGEGE